MSAGLPHLHAKNKKELTELAELSNLPDHSKLKKAELEVALDDHLRKNASTYSNEPQLSTYYERVGSSSRSPVKKLAEKVSDVVKSDDDAAAPAKKQRRKTTAAPTEGSASDAAALVKTPAKEVHRRASILASQSLVPPSPAAVTEAIDRQTRRFTASLSRAYNQTQISEYADVIRDVLSSPVALNTIAILFEAFCLRQGILPSKKAGEIPVIPYVTSSRTPVSIPDIFLVLDVTKFWAPFTLWILTSIALPTIVSYFINLPLKAQSSHSYSTRRATTQAQTSLQYDLFIYNIAKGLICYLVYADHFQLFGLYSNFTIATVNDAVYGGYASMLTSAGVGAAVSLYDAALKK